MKAPFLIAAMLFLALGSGFSAEPEIAIRVDPPLIGLEEQASVSVQIDRKAKDIETGNSAGLEIAYRGESHSSQVTIINGVIQSRNSFIYAFVVTPKKTGTFRFGPFKVKIGDKTYLAGDKELKLQVVKQAARKRQGGPGDIFSELDDLLHNRNKVPSVSFSLVPRTLNPLQNQQVILDGYIVSSDRSAFDFQYSQVADIRSDKCALFDITSSIRPDISKSQGQYRKLVKRYVIYPIETGKIGIAPPGIIAITPYGQIQLRTEVVAIESRKIGKSSGLSYVGDLKADVHLSQERLEAGRNGELKLTLTGSGNLKVLSNPYGDVRLEGLYLSSPVIETKFLEYRSNKAYFSQTVKYLVIAKKQGVYSVPPLNIRYHDDQGNPKLISIPSQTVSIVEKNQVILKKNLTLRNLSSDEDFYFLPNNPFLIVILILFAFLPLVSFFYGVQVDRLSLDKDYSRKKLASKRFNKYFSLAKQRLDENDPKGFYTAVQNSVIYYITDKLNLPSGTPFRSLVAAMTERELPAETVQLLEKIWQSCNRNAFSGQDTDTAHQEMIVDLKKLTELFK